MNFTAIFNNNFFTGENMISFKKSAVFIIFSFTLIGSSVCAVESTKSYGKIESDIAKEVECPDGITRLIAVAQEPLVQGIPVIKARSVAQRIATLRAKAILSDFINGSEFEQTTTVIDAIKAQGGLGQSNTNVISEYVGKMRTTALRGIDILDVDYSGNDFVRIAVGFSSESLQVANKYRDISNGSSRRVPYRNDSRRNY